MNKNKKKKLKFKVIYLSKFPVINKIIKRVIYMYT